MEKIVTSVSILVVLITFAIGYWERRRSDRRQRTFVFLRAVIEDEGPIHRANLQFATWLKEGRIFENDVIESGDYTTIVTLVDFYDLISDAALRRVIDEEMIISQLGGRMRSAFNMLSVYIHARRNQLGRPGLYMPFENFVKNRIKNRNV